MEMGRQKSRLCLDWVGWAVFCLNPLDSEELAPSCNHLTFALTSCWGKNDQLTSTIPKISYVKSACGHIFPFASKLFLQSEIEVV